MLGKGAIIWWAESLVPAGSIPDINFREGWEGPFPGWSPGEQLQSVGTVLGCPPGPTWDKAACPAPPCALYLWERTHLTRHPARNFQEGGLPRRHCCPGGSVWSLHHWW